METIHLRQTLPQVFANRDAITSDVWHQDLVLQKGERYLIEAASGTGKSSLCSYIYGYRRDYQGIINFDERNIRSLTIHEWVELRKHSLSMLFQELRKTVARIGHIVNIPIRNLTRRHLAEKQRIAVGGKPPPRPLHCVRPPAWSPHPFRHPPILPLLRPRRPLGAHHDTHNLTRPRPQVSLSRAFRLAYRPAISKYHGLRLVYLHLRLRLPLLPEAPR